MWNLSIFYTDNLYCNVQNQCHLCIEQQKQWLNTSYAVKTLVMSWEYCTRQYAIKFVYTLYCNNANYNSYKTYCGGVSISQSVGLAVGNRLTHTTASKSKHIIANIMQYWIISVRLAVPLSRRLLEKHKRMRIATGWYLTATWQHHVILSTYQQRRRSSSGMVEGTDWITWPAIN